jgi:hypothetical protein
MTDLSISYPPHPVRKTSAAVLLFIPEVSA